MAVFRVERNKGYTVMSNHHLRNKDLSLKAKGLLSQMLSLPEDWDYTLKGLSLINRESIDAIRTAVWELEKAGYITRQQNRDGKGKMADMIYTIYEQPQPRTEQPDKSAPGLGNPVLENPTSDNPTLGNPTLENPMQLNKDISLPAESLTKNNYQHMGGCYFETLPMTLELSTEFLDLEKTQIHVNKVWEDNGNQDKIRPESIIVNLLADGNVVDNARLSEDNHWEHTFNDLDLYNTETKNKIEYSVEEISVEGYTTVMAGNANDGFTITNTHVSPPPAPETGNLTVSKTVSGDGASTEKAFTFTVRLNDTSINGTYGDMTFDKGVAIFTLKAKESKTASGLPAGTGYSVTESDNEGYTVTVNGTTDKEAAGTITANDTAFAGFNNYKSGGGSDPDPEEPAPAKVMLSAQKTLDGSLPVGSDYSFVLKDENGRVIQTVQNHGGSITFNTLTFSKTGTFIYTISEVSGSNSAIQAMVKN